MALKTTASNCSLTSATDISPHPYPSNFDVAIVGGGIVGATIACALKDSGLKILILEAKPTSVAVAKGQAYAISILSSRIFTGLGVWPTLASQVTPFQQIHLSDANSSNVVKFSSQDLETEALGYVAEHKVLLRALQTCLQDCSTVWWWCPAEVIDVEYQPTGAKLNLQVDGQSHSIQAQLVIAADGVRSSIRQQANIQTHGWQYWQSCIVATIKPEKSHQHIAYERFWPSGPFAILPLPHNLCRIVWTVPHAEARTLVELDDAQFIQELSRRYGNHMGKLSLVGQRFVFPVQLMHSTRYVLSRLALVGDAAHCCHPVGGQGINMGIRDAAILAEILQTAHHQGKDIGDIKVLRRYERCQQIQNLQILGFTDFLDRLFSNNWQPIVVLRRVGLWLLQTVPLCKVFALRLMTGLSGRAPLLASEPRCKHKPSPFRFKSSQSPKSPNSGRF